jgi:hypothetical protein
MKSSLERVRVLSVTRHKEPTPLDFDTLFHLTDNYTTTRIQKENNISPTLHLYSNETQTTTTYLIVKKYDQSPRHVMKAIFQIMNDEEFDYYVITVEAFANLPLGKRQECLIIKGESKDGSKRLESRYNIIRIKPDDDTSKIIRLEKLDGTGCTFRAELTVKRKWFSSMEEIMQSALEASAEDEVYCYVDEIEQEGMSISKMILITHKDNEVLRDAIQPLVGEEILKFRKERNCHNVSVLKALQLGNVGSLKKNGIEFFIMSLRIYLSEDYKGEYQYRLPSDSSDESDVILTFSRRNDDDYAKAVPIQRRIVKSMRTTTNNANKVVISENTHEKKLQLRFLQVQDINEVMPTFPSHDGIQDLVEVMCSGKYYVIVTRMDLPSLSVLDALFAKYYTPWEEDSFVGKIYPFDEGLTWANKHDKVPTEYPMLITVASSSKMSITQLTSAFIQNPANLRDTGLGRQGRICCFASSNDRKAWEWFNRLDESIDKEINSQAVRLERWVPDDS